MTNQDLLDTIKGNLIRIDLLSEVERMRIQLSELAQLEQQDTHVFNHLTMLVQSLERVLFYYMEDTWLREDPDFTAEFDYVLELRRRPIHK